MKKSILALLILLFVTGCRKDKQPDKEKDDEFVATTFVIPNQAIVINPSGNAPLSALLTFTSALSGHTEIVVKGKNGEPSDIKQVFEDSGTSHAIPIIGLYPNFENTVEVTVVNDNGDKAKSSIKITTGPLPANVPNYIHVDVADYANMESGVNLVSGFSGYPNGPLAPYIVDNYGDIRWILDFSNNTELNKLFYDDGISRIKNGNYLFADQISGKIYEVDILGKIINRWELGGYTFHHEVLEKPDGNFLVTVNKPGSTNTKGVPTIEDYIIEINRTSGQITNTWDLKESLDEYRTAFTTNSEDWMHVNAVTYDAKDNTIIVSGRHQAVVKLNYANQVKWILAPHRGWGKNRRGEDLNKFLLKPIDGAGNPITDAAVIEGTVNHPSFEWNWYQHSPIFTPSGNLMLFDNGDSRNYNVSAATHYSRAVEYKIDETSMTIQQVWDYGKDRKEEAYSRIVSSVKYLKNKDHILFSPGFQVPNATGMGGKVIEVDRASKNVIFQLSISSPNGFGFHRVERLELYPNGKPYQ
ncbi:aryl-sulfate sulfotransferase [Mucilaginibacter sp.]|jgi:arylsulfate sulfotransferase|uniref:aryl-sulfate sulfotransferase n=1 Tax=Mucilaginibacter sp. TaxID=1882438 RepID=UPI00356A5F4B